MIAKPGNYWGGGGGWVNAANEINNYFCRVSIDLSSKFTTPLDIEPLAAPPVHCDSIQPLSLRHVTKQINQIDPNKPSGFVNLPSKLLRIALQSIPEPLTILLNLCIMKSVFPQSWKKGIVVCIPKSGDCRQLTNLPPISLLPITGKILEFFLNETIMRNLEQNHLLDQR